jgi:hypothetical protein
MTPARKAAPAQAACRLQCVKRYDTVCFEIYNMTALQAGDPKEKHR